MKRTFLEIFEENHIPEPNSGCWIWTGAIHGVMTENRRPVGAHRISWRLFRSEIPPGKQVLHRCDNPPCVNPDHLFLGSQAENVADCIKKGRDRRLKGKQGPRLSPASVLDIRAWTESHVATAARYGVSVDAIEDIRHGRSWKKI